MYRLNYFPFLFYFIITSPNTQSNYFRSNALTKLSLIPYYSFILIIYIAMLFPSPSVWKMVNYAPNYIPENIIV